MFTKHHGESKMDLFGNQSAVQTGLNFPAPLTDKYRPRKVADFAGLDKVKRILGKFAANPQGINFYFLGPSGTGKTSMALALAQEIGAQVYHLPSQKCTLAELEEKVRQCHYVPMSGYRCNMILIDEADGMSKAATDFCLSRLDGTAPVPDTIWVFTGNAMPTDPEGRFKPRVMTLDFSSYGMSAEATELLQSVWSQEVGTGVPAPNFSRLVKDAQNNVRESLMALQREILAA
jgi:DNA polymerase III delta prime subunit